MPRVNTEANARRMALVESCFGSAGQPLSIPGRVLVGEGVLTKSCRKKLKPRQFFLFNDLLVYGNIIINKKKYNKQHIIPLEQVKLQSLEDEGQFRNGWLICTTHKSFAVYAATAVEKQEWMAHIEKCIKDLITKGGKKPANEHAAVWVPDAEADSCMICKKSQFTLVNRRHHCRKCGAVACGQCSNHKFLLPNQSSKPLRVCTPCYDELTKTKSDNPASIQAPAGKGFFAPPPRPPPPSLSDAMPEAEAGDVAMPPKNPRLYQLVAMSQDSTFWWDSVDAAALPDEADDAVSTHSFESSISARVVQDRLDRDNVFDAEGKSTDSSGEDDSDEDDNGAEDVGASPASAVANGKPNFYPNQEE